MTNSGRPETSNDNNGGAYRLRRTGGGVSVRALDTRRSTGERLLRLEIQKGYEVIEVRLSASQAAELMFALGFELEEASRMANGRPLRRHVPLHLKFPSSSRDVE